MSINQFAKISPIIDSNGYLYNLNPDGTVEGTETTAVRLKNNEIGIIYNEDVLAVMYDGNLKRLGIAVYNTDSLNDVLNNNINGDLNGKLIILNKNDNYYIGIIDGSSVKCPEFNVVHAAVFTVTDDFVRYSDSYIGYLPYKILRVTVKIDEDVGNIITSDGNSYSGNINIKAADQTTKEIASIQYRDIEYSSTGTKYELLECQNIFKDFVGEIKVSTDSETKNKNIQVCVEYMISNNNLHTVEVNTNG